MAYNPTGSMAYGGQQPLRETEALVDEGSRQVFDKAQMAQSIAGSEALILRCARCSQIVPTKISFDVGAGNHATAFLTCITGGWLGCFLVPYCCDDCKDAVHSCPYCGNILAKRYIM
eukprot:TRINITY_DN1630_c0_g2_i1.p1 TRINITY_DN1630_c0_g2~~TRINITY_DN1630_c0_g2_i1.p1  ORF type:complete len:117 (-),score=19.33 TRINITY_DN1630_c0_g2_i1:196-546(-)